MARTLMIQGTSSWAGKSLLTTALARLIRRQGIDVAPFKGVNMSNNARVVDGGEIGVAQYLQAIAAGVEPSTLMNPVLVKPTGETESQVVIDGQVDLAVSAVPWRDRAPLLQDAVDRALAALLEQHEFVIAEGAGSPAEINLYDFDLANMHVARAADARVLLVADINRGGSFAHLYGTWALLPEDDRARICGFVLNRFRGDPELLAPGPQLLEEKTGVPVLGVVPWLDHKIPDEDGVAQTRTRPGDDAPRVAIVRYPAASNLDEFKPLDAVARVIWASTPADLEGADLVILPGSKHVGSDLRWLRATGFATALTGRVLAICGGAQMLGEQISDPHDLEGGDVDGLGILPITTELEPEKTLAQTTSTFGHLGGSWGSLSGVKVSGYEIRHGRSAPSGAIESALPDDRGWADGDTLAVYLHGLFENAGFLRAVLGVDPGADVEAAIDDLADAVAPHLDLDAILALTVA